MISCLFGNVGQAQGSIIYQGALGNRTTLPDTFSCGLDRSDCFTQCFMRTNLISVPSFPAQENWSRHGWQTSAFSTEGLKDSSTRLATSISGLTRKYRFSRDLLTNQLEDFIRLLPGNLARDVFAVPNSQPTWKVIVFRNALPNMTERKCKRRSRISAMKSVWANRISCLRGAVAEGNAVSPLPFLAGLMSLSAHSGSGGNGLGRNTAGNVWGLLKVNRDALFESMILIVFYSRTECSALRTLTVDCFVR